MRECRLMVIGFLAMFFSAGMAFAVTPAEQQANAELESMAKDIAQLSATPGFRGFLRSEIAQSKNRENIVELDEFLSRAMKQKNMPPGLDKLQNKARNAKGRVKAFSVADRLDLYIPVGAHRAKWKGGQDFLVAFSPVQDEKNTKEIVAYSVKDGRRVLLNPNQAPAEVVLVIAPCEHETHQYILKPDPNAPPEGMRAPLKDTSPPGQIAPNEKKDKEEIGKYKGNSNLYVYFTLIKRTQEPWYMGKPEIEVYILHECGGIPVVRRLDMNQVDEKNKSYYTANNGSLYYGSNCSDFTAVAIWERDGGSLVRGECHKFPGSGKTHCYQVRSSDDPVQYAFGTTASYGVFYKSAFPYNSVYDNFGPYGDFSVVKLP